MANKRLKGVMDFALPEVKFEKGLVIHRLPAQAYEQIRKREWNRMDKKQLIQNAIFMLESVDPDTIEVVNLDRTEYDDGSVGFSVNLTTPANKLTFMRNGEEVKISSEIKMETPEVDKNAVKNITEALNESRPGLKNSIRY